MAGGDTRPPPPLVPVLVGPTGVGKTAVVAAWARLRRLAVISADSRQVYRGLDIGTAKPPAALRREVRHLGLDLIEPGERYSAGRFAREAAAWIAEARGRNETPVIAGGTGLYVRALADGLFREPALDPDRRQALADWLRRRTGAEMARWAARLDPRFGRPPREAGGRQRASRAVEVALLSGRPLSWWQVTARAQGVMRPWYVRLTLPRAALRRRIEARVGDMLAAGFVEEVRTLLARGVDPEAPGLDGLGYREVVAHLQGRLAAAELPEAIAAATRRYAKRQETWFRHQLGNGEGGKVWALDATEPAEALAARIEQHWRTVPEAEA